MTKMRLIAIKYFNRLTALVIIICKGYYMFNTCKLCSEYLYRVYVMLCYTMFCYVILCYGRFFGRRLVVRISVPSLTLCHFVHLTNKRLVTCNLNTQPSDLESDTQISLSNRHASH